MLLYIGCTALDGGLIFHTAVYLLGKMKVDFIQEDAVFTVKLRTNLEA